MSTTRGRPKPRSPGRRAADRLRSRIWAGSIFLVAVIAAVVFVPRFFAGPGGDEVSVPPDELMGTWSTDDPRYVDRTITIAPQQVTLGLGPDGPISHTITSIRVVVALVHREYRITYAGSEGEEMLDVFVYDDGLMRLRNPSEAGWRKATN
jgi:hypothetical protein